MREAFTTWRRTLYSVCFFGAFIHLLYLALPIYLMAVYDRVLFTYSRASLATLTVGCLFALVLMGVLEYLRGKVLLRAGDNLQSALRPRVLQAMHSDASGVRKAGYTRGLRDLAQIREAVTTPGLLALLDAPWVLIYLVLLFLMSPVLGAAAASGVLVAGVCGFLFHSLTRKRNQTAEPVLDQGEHLIGASLRNAETVSGMGMQRNVLRRWRSLSQTGLRLLQEADGYVLSLAAVNKALQLVCVLGVYGAGAWLFFNDRITVGIMFAAAVIMARVFFPLLWGAAYLPALQRALAAKRRIARFVSQDPGESTLSLPPPQGRLDVEGAALAVEGKSVLRGMTFSLSPGEILGVIGPSGAGKSSLLRMLLGVWPCAAGTVRLDGADIVQWDRDELGGYLGYLPQEAELFPGAVKDNIARFGEVGPDRVIRAGHKAGAHEMILHLADGYDTELDNTARNLSAGQRQRIAMARAVYGDPSLVVLDQPQTHLDDQGTESLLTMLDALREEGSTVVLATDRPHILQKTDKLLLLKEGQIAMFGPSKEVMQKLASPSEREQEAPEATAPGSG